MVTTIRSNLKKSLLALGVLCMGLALTAQTASAGDWQRRDAKRANAYTGYTEEETVAMLDAINRDHPVSYSGMNGANGANPYLQYDDKDPIALIDAVNKGSAPSRSVAVGSYNGYGSAGTYAANPYLAYQDTEMLALVDALGRNQGRTVVSAPSYTPVYIAPQPAQAAPANVVTDQYAHTYSFEGNG